MGNCIKDVPHVPIIQRFYAYSGEIIRARATLDEIVERSLRTFDD